MRGLHAFEQLGYARVVPDVVIRDPRVERVYREMTAQRRHSTTAFRVLVARKSSAIDVNIFVMHAVFRSPVASRRMGPVVAVA